MGRANSFTRRRENMLLRYLYRHAPSLARYPVAYDAVAEGPVVEGGDAMVIDRHTLFLGTGNRTDPRAAPILARALDMDVIAVQTVKRDFLRPRRPGEPWKLAQLKILFLHLDTFFTQVGPKHALTIPFLLEKAHGQDNPLARFIRGARAESAMDEGDAEAALTMIEEFGRVKRYRRSTGALDDLGDLKLVDHVRQQGWRITPVGGPVPSGDEAAFRHFMSVVHPELHRQAANVVQAVPGRVIAYAGNPRTKAALEADGIAVDSFEARELWAWSGGPHCLTQPLERS
jgi:arginine deiminase